MQTKGEKSQWTKERVNLKETEKEKEKKKEIDAQKRSNGKQIMVNHYKYMYNNMSFELLIC